MRKHVNFTKSALAALCMLSEFSLTAGKMTLGYEYDITREKVPTSATIRRVVDILSSLGYEQLQLYFKDNFAYPEHRSIWQGRAFLTPEEVKDLDAYCRSKGIDLVPYQSSFGHLEPWLKREEYRRYAEHPAGKYFNTAVHSELKATAICPSDPQSLQFLNGLFDVLMPCFSSSYANLGCDEVWDLHSETGRSAAEIREKGVGRVYFEFIMKLRDSLKARGKTLMFWGDIIRNYPELVAELPPDVIALDWNYEASAPFHLTTAALKRAPCRYYVCPGTSSWRSYFGRHKNMRINVLSAFRWGQFNDAEGLLLTDWGDSGYPQPWIVSLPAIVYTSLLMKSGKRPTDENAPSDEAVAAKVDEICGCRVGASLIRAGNAYLRAVDPNAENSTLIFRLASSPKTFKMPSYLTIADFESAVSWLRESQAMRDLSGAPDWVKDDIELLDILIDFVARRVAGETGPLSGRYRARYSELWLRQNRPGGIEESLAKVFGRE